MSKRKFNDDDSSDDDLQLINAANEYEKKLTKKIRKSFNNVNEKIDDDIQFLNKAFDFERNFNETYINNAQLIGSGLAYDTPLYTKHKEITKYVKKFDYILKMIEYHASNVKANDIISSMNQTKQFIDNLVTQFVNTQKANTKIGICINHDLFTDAINLPFQLKQQIKPEVIWNVLEKTIQSKKKTEKLEIKDMHKIVVTFKIAELKQGGVFQKLTENVSYSARKKREARELQRKKKEQLSKETINQQQYIQNSKHVLKIINTDNNCFMRALMLAVAYINKDPDRFKYQSEKKEKFNEIVNSKIAQCGLINNEFVGRKEIRKIQSFFPDVQIMVIDEKYRNYLNTPFYLNKNKKYNKHVYILFHDNHYDVITSIKRYLKAKYYCHQCKIGCSHKERHICAFKCKCCHRDNEICITENLVQCVCNEFTRNDVCKQVHLKYCKTNNKLICQKCSTNFNSFHVCIDQKYCKSCKKVVDLDSHKCFILKEKKKHKTKKEKIYSHYIFFDFETKIDKQSNQHVVNLAVAKKLCLSCINNLDENTRCNDCKQYYKFPDINSFCEWLLQQTKSIVIAHNLKGYDGIFIYNYFLKNIKIGDTLSGPSTITNGSKLMAIMWRSLRIIDSLCFIPSSLSAFSKTFDINEKKKGFFPHLFNTADNQNYNGTWPDATYYQPDFMSKSKRDEFFEWYEQHKHKTFNFQKELEQYCFSDVDLLTEGCIRYRLLNLQISKSNKDECGVDPFLNSFTIASYCNLVYRKKYMKENSIGLIPENGYHPKQNTSKKARQWLKYIAETEKIHIIHAMNSDEFKIGPYYVDGICHDKKIIYEFHGCHWHGCTECFTPDTYSYIKRSTMKEINDLHNLRISYLETNKPEGYQLIQIWEHEWDDLCISKEEIKQFVKQNPVQAQLNPRNCMFGGRTNGLNLYRKTNQNEKISYIDYTSLYPYVQKYKRFPIGHPEIITENINCSNNFYFGLMKCRLIPPKKLYIPIIPARINGKLMFPLCFKCASESNTNCTHSENERALEGEWCTLEIYEAIKYGYKLDYIYEVWHWKETTKLDKTTNIGGLFTEYINAALKIKQEASGFPDHVKTEEQKDEYIEQYFKKEGIKLDKDKIKKNSGLRQIAKWMLNSLWGRLAMNSNKKQIKAITDPNEWQKMLSNDAYIISDIHCIEDNEIPVLNVSYKLDQEFDDGNDSINVAIASFVTCHARLHLYSELNRLQDRVLYFDTDSIIYITRENDTYEPETGVYLGEFTNELDVDEYITEFVCAGPKNYAYKTNKGHTECTIKGFTLNYVTSLKITFESIRDIVTNDQSNKIPVEQSKFRINPKHWTIETKHEIKNYAFVYDKRILLENLTTLPWGYIHE